MCILYVFILYIYVYCCRGINPSDADFRLLDTARKTDYYGVVLHSAQDHEGKSVVVVRSN